MNKQLHKQLHKQYVILDFLHVPHKTHLNSVLIPFKWHLIANISLYLCSFALSLGIKQQKRLKGLYNHPIVTWILRDIAHLVFFFMLRLPSRIRLYISISRYLHTLAFCSFSFYPPTELDPDATKLNGKANTLFVTRENTAATVLSDIEGYQADRIYKVVCGSLTNKTTVSKAGKFAKIESDFVPVKVGDWIKFRAELEDYEEEIDGETVTLTRPTGNFLEVERKLY